MISLKDRLIILHGKSKPIVKFDVWFRTPKGLSTHLDVAVEVCISMDADPDLMIKPVPVAIADDGTYEEL